MGCEVAAADLNHNYAVLPKENARGNKYMVDEVPLNLSEIDSRGLELKPRSNLEE